MCMNWTLNSMLKTLRREPKPHEHPGPSGDWLALRERFKQHSKAFENRTDSESITQGRLARTCGFSQTASAR